MIDDRSKFELFKYYKEEIEENKERYKPVLLELLEQDDIYDDICDNIYEEIIELWEKEWEEEPNIYIDKLKFKDDIFEEYKEEIEENKERYKPILLELLKKNKIDNWIYKEMIELWEKEWKEESNEYINKLKIEIAKGKFKADIFEEYKEEISRDKERYKPALLELLEKDKINENIYKEIIELWEKEWKEEPNIYIDKLKFKNRNLFQEYKEEIGNDEERYKPILLGLLKENKIETYMYNDMIELWEEDWKENPNIEIDKLKFRVDYIYYEYNEEIEKNKERYKPILLELLEQDKINKNVYKGIVDLWEKEWKEVPNINIDKLKFYYYSYYKINLFKEYKEEIIKNKERYKPALLKAVEEHKINSDIYKEIIDIWEEEWKEKQNIELDKLIFEDWYFDRCYENYLNFDENEDDDYNYKQALKTKKLVENPERYKPVLLKLLEENINNILGELGLCPSVVTLWEKEWEEEPNIEIDKLKFYNEDAFLDFEDEIIENPERYKPILTDLILENGSDFYELYEHILDEWEELEM